MYTLLISIILIASFLIIIVVLMQASKGSGLAGTFGGVGEVGTMFGVRRTADFLSKATWWLAGTIAVLSLIINLAFLPSSSQSALRESIIQSSGRQSIPQRPALPRTQQNQPTQQQQQPQK